MPHIGCPVPGDQFWVPLAACPPVRTIQTPPVRSSNLREPSGAVAMAPHGHDLRPKQPTASNRVLLAVAHPHQVRGCQMLGATGGLPASANRSNLPVQISNHRKQQASKSDLEIHRSSLHRSTTEPHPGGMLTPSASMFRRTSAQHDLLKLILGATGGLPASANRSNPPVQISNPRKQQASKSDLEIHRSSLNHSMTGPQPGGLLTPKARACSEEQPRNMTFQTNAGCHWRLARQCEPFKPASTEFKPPQAANVKERSGDPPIKSQSQHDRTTPGWHAHAEGASMFRRTTAHHGLPKTPSKRNTNTKTTPHNQKPHSSRFIINVAVSAKNFPSISPATSRISRPSSPHPPPNTSSSASSIDNRISSTHRFRSATPIENGICRILSRG